MGFYYFFFFFFVFTFQLSLAPRSFCSYFDLNQRTAAITALKTRAKKNPIRLPLPTPSHDITATGGFIFSIKLIDIACYTIMPKIASIQVDCKLNGMAMGVTAAF